MARIAGDLKERTVTFGTNVLRAIRALPNDPTSWSISKQFIRAATSIGANVWEADVAHTDSDFAHKISIARKEASETLYWLELIRRTGLLSVEIHGPLSAEASELLKVLSTVVRKTQEHIGRG